MPKISSPTIPSGTSSVSSGGSGVSTASKSGSKAAAASSAVGSFDVGSFRMAEEKDRGTTINLTVTGAFDKEGTARTIVETLNDSYYRGTGGAGALAAI